RSAAQAMRQEQLAKERRRRNLMAGGGVLVVLIVIGILIAVGLKDKHGGATAVTASVAQAVTQVPAATFDAVGKGTVEGPATPVKWPALTESGKPKILFVGAEWCPYCAAQRWVMAVALSRFGTFNQLGEVYSAADDGDLASLTFHGSTYKSDYLVFDANEIQDRDHKDLDKLSAADAAIYNKYSQGFPFIDIAGQYQTSAMYNIETISGMTQQQIADALKNPNSPVAQAIIGSANSLTATICKVTGNKPANVCDSAGVRAAS
ncbi:MAG TPA: DUF929 family protein, partial [Marmoricola sp.]|nr:DUF929 family protein [Marmoricola sp.]